MLIRMPRAPSMAPASSNGEAIAAWGRFLGAIPPDRPPCPLTRVAIPAISCFHVGKVAG